MSRGDPLRVRDYLEHIAEAIANIQEGASTSLTLRPFTKGGACIFRAGFLRRH